MNLILFGFKGCGKTYFGKLLAQKMDRPFIDTDDLITQRFLLPITTIYQQLGETLFRAVEKETIQTLHNVKNSVIALGGGAILDPENVNFLQKIGQLFYLSQSPAILKKRCGQNALFQTDVEFEQLFQKRKPIYESIPAIKIDCEQLTEESLYSFSKEIRFPTTPEQ